MNKSQIRIFYKKLTFKIYYKNKPNSTNEIIFKKYLLSIGSEFAIIKII